MSAQTVPVPAHIPRERMVVDFDFYSHQAGPETNLRLTLKRLHADPENFSSRVISPRRNSNGPALPPFGNGPAAAGRLPGRERTGVRAEDRRGPGVDRQEAN